MARQPKPRKKEVGKSVYWFTKAGGETYFGNVEEVPHTEAQRLLRQHLHNLSDAARDRKKVSRPANLWTSIATG